MRWWQPKFSILSLHPGSTAAAAGGGDEWEWQDQEKAWSWQRQVAMGMWALLFFFFFSWSLWIFVVQAWEPYSLEEAFLAAARSTDSPSPALLGTEIYGEKAARAFRHRLACFSESGAWEYDVTPRRLPWNFAGDPFANQCDGRHVSTPGNVAGLQADEIAQTGEASAWKVREELRWVWRTNSSCPMLPLDRDHFCRLIGANNNVLLVGDSISHELQWAFTNAFLLGTANRSAIAPSLSPVRSWQGLQVCDDVLLGRGFKVGFVRNDRLSPTLQVRDDGWSNVLEWPWLPLLGPWGVRVLLLNRGAHFQPDAAFQADLDQTLSLLRREFPHLLVVFRNTPPGHRNCGALAAPLKERQTDLPPEWHWGDFARQNRLAEALAARHGVLYMDCDTALSLRPDGHIDANDCLHYCLPGPLDYVPHLLYNILRLLPHRYQS